MPFLTHFKQCFIKGYSNSINPLRPRQNECYFTDDTFKCIFMNENVSILIKISLKFVPKVLINNIPALVQIMTSRWPGNKPLSEPMMVRLPTHICITRPQWVNKGSHLTPVSKCIIRPSFIFASPIMHHASDSDITCIAQQVRAKTWRCDENISLFFSL